MSIENSNLLQFAIFFLALILAVDVHEFSHVLSAYLQGDQTGKSLGRLTLNPLRHLDRWGTLFMVFAAMTGIGIGWGKPAPFNPYALRFRKWGPALVAVAGPVSNILIMALAGWVLLLLGQHLTTSNLLLNFLGTLVIFNAALAVFNLIPIAPLDGSHILRTVLGEGNPLVQVLERYGFVILIFILLFGRGVLGAYISGGVNLLLRGVGLGSWI